MGYFCIISFKYLVNENMKNVKFTMAAFYNCYGVKENHLIKKLYKKILNTMFLAPKQPLPNRLAPNQLVPK